MRLFPPRNRNPTVIGLDAPPGEYRWIRPLPTRETVRPLSVPVLKPLSIPVAKLDVSIEALTGVTGSTIASRPGRIWRSPGLPRSWWVVEDVAEAGRDPERVAGRDAR